MSISWCIEPACQLCSFGKFFNFFCGCHLNFVSDAMFFFTPLWELMPPVVDISGCTLAISANASGYNFNRFSFIKAMNTETRN